MTFNQNKILGITLVTILLSLALPIQADPFVVDFEFTTTDDEVKSISDYYGKPILIEWAATWCTVCKNNQESIAEIYDEFKDNVTFISLSYFASGDTLEDVKEMKSNRGYSWIFGLDDTKYSGDYKAYNGDNWLLNDEGVLVKTWNGTIVTPEDLATAFENELGLTNTYNSEGLVVGIDYLFIISSSLILLVSLNRRD